MTDEQRVEKVTDNLKKKKKKKSICKILHADTQEAFRNTNWVEHEAVDSLAGGEHDHGGAAVEGVARRHKVPARLQGVLLGGLVICGLRETV